MDFGKFTLELLEKMKDAKLWEKPHIHFCGECNKVIENPELFIMGFPFCPPCHTKIKKNLERFSTLEEDK